jgi:hypothetical protein
MYILHREDCMEALMGGEHMTRTREDETVNKLDWDKTGLARDEREELACVGAVLCYAGLA